MLDFIFPRVCPFCESISKDGKVCNSCLSRIRFIGGSSICLRCGVPFDSAEIPDPDANPFISAASSVALDNISEEQGDMDALNISKWRPCTLCRRTSDNERPDEVAPTAIRGHLCGECLLGGFNFERARSVAFYDGLLRDMLHKFKYEGKLKFGGGAFKYYDREFSR